MSTIVCIPLLSIPKSAKQTGSPNSLLNAAISFLFSISPAQVRRVNTPNETTSPCKPLEPSTKVEPL